MPSSEIVTISTPIRLVNYLAIGALLGWFAAHYREANAELQVLAQRDLVTGLPNTRAFEQAIDRRLALACARSRCSSATSTRSASTRIATRRCGSSPTRSPACSAPTPTWRGSAPRSSPC